MHLLAMKRRVLFSITAYVHIIVKGVDVAAIGDLLGKKGCTDCKVNTKNANKPLLLLLTKKKWAHYRYYRRHKNIKLQLDSEMGNP